MIGFEDLKPKIKIILEGQPYEIISLVHISKARGKAIISAKLKNLKTGTLVSKTFRPKDEFEEAQFEEINLKFLYQSKGNFYFLKNSQKISLSEKVIKNKKNFLKNGQTVKGLLFKNELINILLPIKISLKVISAPPSVKKERETGGTKKVLLETGAEIDVPLFIKEGDLVEINTQTGTYVRRIKS